MSKSQPADVTQPEDPALDDFSKLDTDQQLSIVCSTIESLCLNLEQRGVDPELVNAVLLESFAARMADVNDRSGYEEMLQEALDTEWTDVTIH